MTESKKRKPDFTEFRSWLTSLAMHDPILHINGTDHPIAAITVDFGNPLTEQRMTPEQNAELVNRMRAAIKALYQKDVTMRVQNDSLNGIWWASVG